ncbi:hypothetical protein [Nocardioides terrisoli]|uniref:hypothetical protein n=1 Tax=Nocardioides terrisoli TaxID=3388267 RepID=UPI00287BAA27|nr:hypothetical protein [Nocardioides marmorisolisilvae]
MTAAPRRERPPKTWLVRGLILLASVVIAALMAPVVPASGAPTARSAPVAPRLRHTGVSVSWPRGPWRVGQRVHLEVRVQPRGRRKVRLQEKVSGGSWRSVGSAAHTHKSGSGRLSWRAMPAGTAELRVKVSATKTRRATTSKAVKRRISGEFLSVKAPGTVAEGSVFIVEFDVRGNEQSLQQATLTVTAPKAGSQVKPSQPAIDSTTHRGSISTNEVRKGTTWKPKLRWQAPTEVTSLRYQVRLTAAGGVTQSAEVTVRVRAGAGGSFHFDGNLTFMRQAIGKPQRVNGGHLYADCTARTGVQRVVSFEDTLAAIDAATRPGTRAAGWQRLDLARHPEDADDVAAVALAAQQPLAALAAAIAGYRGSVPAEQTNYLNIAGASANMAGHPGWAIALETKAGSLPQAGSVGAKTSAVRLTNLGHGYALMGDWTTAKSWLDRAVAADGSSPQVEQEAFVVDYCVGNKDSALTAFGKSIRADDTTDEVNGNSGSDDPFAEPTNINASRLMDISAGVQAGPFQMPVVPSSIAEEDARADDGYYSAESQRVSAHLQALRKQLDQLYDQVRTQSTTVAERTRLTALMTNYSTDGEQSVLKADQKILTAEGNLWSANNCDGQYQDVQWCAALVGGDDEDCAEDQAIFTQWKERMQAFIDSEAAYINAMWPVSTGVEANIANAAARKYFDVARQADVYFSLQLTYSEFNNSSALPDHCGGAAGTDPKDPTAPDAAAAQCGSVASKLALSLDWSDETDPELPVGFSAKVSCQQVDFEIDLNALPFLAGFVDISTTPTGGITVMVGSKLSASVHHIGTSFSSAFYVTFDQSAKTPVDIGVDAGFDGEAAAGPGHLSLFSDHVHMSAINTYADPYKDY